MNTVKIPANHKKIGKHYGPRAAETGYAYGKSGVDFVFISVVGDKDADEYGAAAHFTPKRARQFAQAILDAADYVEAQK